MQNQEASFHKEKEVSQETEQKGKLPKKPKKEKFTWWQTLLILFLTLGISIGAGYFISDKYFWSGFDQNQLKKQFEHYKNQVDAQPNDPQHRVNLGYSYFLLGKNEEAIKQFKVALDLDKNFYDAYLNLGIVYLDEERLDEGLKMATKASEIAPRDYKSQLLKGTAYRKLKMYDESLETLSKANELMPGNTDIITELGKVAEDQGDKKNAEELFKEALNYDPLYKPALEGLDRVAAK
ncbi:tetratricopeptide repeat protein [Neobacillus sp. NPDC093182]|uniref:tetratricopeptide repeat protein n=1 Tax=Neobacillus sp. NPDC093182 TaxID=3364297 RepID=UPI0038121E0B